MRSWSLEPHIFVVLVGDVVAAVVALVVVDEGLEVEVGQLVHHLEEDVLEELVVELGSTGQYAEVRAVRGQAAVHNQVLACRWFLSQDDWLQNELWVRLSKWIKLLQQVMKSANDLTRCMARRTT